MPHTKCHLHGSWKAQWVQQARQNPRMLLLLLVVSGTSRRRQSSKRSSSSRCQRNNISVHSGSMQNQPNWRVPGASSSCSQFAFQPQVRH